MSTHNQTHNTADDSAEFLAPFIEAARDDVSEDNFAAAANRVRAVIPQPEASSRKRRSMFGLGTAAAMLAVVLLVGQTFMPGNSASAFAAVQRWFSDFQNVHINTRISSGGAVVVNVEVWALANGTVRIEQGGMVQILDSDNATFHTLMPNQRYFSQELQGKQQQPQTLDWFEDIREFKGEATLLPESRLVSGINAQGYQLQADGVDLTLWSDPVSHQPLLLEGALPGGLQMISTLDFDTDMSMDLFQVPNDYQLIEAERD